MAVEYDLIVIGASREGIYAALTGARFNARVALVEQGISQQNHAWGEIIKSRTLSHKTRLHQFLELEKLATEVSFSIQDRLAAAGEWATEVLSTLAEESASAVLATVGVDVIQGFGEFVRLPNQAFVVEKRRLLSRTYLVATGAHLVVPKVAGIEEISYLKIDDIWQQNKLQPLPENLMVVGGDPQAIVLAQNLAKLGKKITLVIPNERILLAEDGEAAMLIQAELEAEKVRVITQSPLTQIKKIEQTKWIQVGNRALETEEIIFVGEKQANVAGLNLASVGVQFGREGIKVNEKLQTTNRRIYACGDVIGGYQFPHIAEYETKIALKNALFFPLFKVDYSYLPWTIFTEPNLARVGMTEAQARQRYGKEVFVVREYFQSNARAQILGETTGFCKFIIRRQGEILGAHIVGVEAGELISAIAVAIQQKIKLSDLAKIYFPSPTLAEIIAKTAREGERQRLSENKTLLNLCDRFFDFRRNWSK
ncbi:dihydrolipoyl dehydrogenase family protein [Oscillatoria salina]|uniref:dihydrolipoyl dehydrogenase family protein n=1 Tax=Oscillatoria salina TaxID=331517 RepID=UPI0013B8A631|nr:NAD(P)/FAD-dependent oxidoreductase [Oscillatoria salina]MBZ8181164.1 NAD(P)/FAD-dependent oxidoreductase [Oscillatoria salina IIICB1]NET88863.1 NAD(P)/FAD-dependent oxidoreductase [Kamptonema sp. SIO1D9]